VGARKEKYLNVLLGCSVNVCLEGPTLRFCLKALTRIFSTGGSELTILRFKALGCFV